MEAETLEQKKQPRTFILMWNPSISSYKMRHFERDLLRLMYDDLDDFDWSIWDWKIARRGDRCYLVKVGEGATGVVMSGVFDTNPYISEDWSGGDRVVHYMGVDVQYMLHPDKMPILSSETLRREIPDFDWSKGHSGVELSVEMADKLEALWQRHIEANASAFVPVAAKATDIWELTQQLNQIE